MSHPTTIPRARRPATWRAFTLLELLAAMTLLSTLLALLLLGTATAMTSWQRVQQQARRLDEQLRLERTCDQLLANALPFTWPGEDRQERLQFVGQPEQVRLTCRHPLNRLAAGRLRLAMIQRDGDDLVVDYVECAPWPDSLQAAGVNRSLLARGVRRVQFAYADFDNDQLVWREEWGERQYLPLAIRMTVAWLDGNTTTWLRRTGGSAAYERQGDWRQQPLASTGTVATPPR